MDERIITITGIQNGLIALTNQGRLLKKNFCYEGWTEIDLPELKKAKPKAKKSPNHTKILLGPGQTVSITEEQKENLLKEMTESELEKLANSLESYQARTGKKYADHYLTMLNWHRREQKTNKNKNENNKREI